MSSFCLLNNQIKGRLVACSTPKCINEREAVEIAGGKSELLLINPENTTTPQKKTPLLVFASISLCFHSSNKLRYPSHIMMHDSKSASSKLSSVYLLPCHQSLHMSCKKTTKKSRQRCQYVVPPLKPAVTGISVHSPRRLEVCQRKEAELE